MHASVPLPVLLALVCLWGTACANAGTADYNVRLLKAIEEMPAAGIYAKYRSDLPEARRFDDLHRAVQDLGQAIRAGENGRLVVEPDRAAGCGFCSSATYLLFCRVVAELQREGCVSNDPALSRALATVGDEGEVIAGKLDGIGLFGHWNADGPGTAVLFRRLDLGTNFTDIRLAKPGDFLKIFWNEHIGKGERGHSVVYLGEAEGGESIRVWSSQTENDDGSAGYGVMTVEKSRIVRMLFSRLERPENLVNWLK
ncbi:MAG: hypothetical protein KDL87_03530, partial [Verrucomicrobiae bacterium]|nr:hypothetical protein [Verrucomicrobiae bacterium]